MPIARLRRHARRADWADGVDDMFGRQLSRAGDHRRAGWTALRIAAARFGHDLRAAAAMDGPIDPAAAGQMTVGRIDDGIDRLIGDVPFVQFENPPVNVCPHDDTYRPGPMKDWWQPR